MLALDLFLPRPRPLPPATRAASSCSWLRLINHLSSHREWDPVHRYASCSFIFPYESYFVECIDSFWNERDSHVTLLITYPVLLTFEGSRIHRLIWRRGGPIWQKWASPISFVGRRQCSFVAFHASATSPYLDRGDQWKLIKADGIVHTIAGKVSSHAPCPPNNLMGNHSLVINLTNTLLAPTSTLHKIMKDSFINFLLSSIRDRHTLVQRSPK